MESKDLDTEMIHFMTIFLLQSSLSLYCQAVSVQDHGTQWFMKMVLTVFSDWLDISLRNFLLNTNHISDPEDKLLQCRLEWFGLRDMYMYVLFSGMMWCTLILITAWPVMNLLDSFCQSVAHTCKIKTTGP